MSYRPPRNVRFHEVASGKEALGVMHRRGFEVVAACPICRVRIWVDLKALIELVGPDVTLWNRKARCKVMEGRIRCAGKVVFLARHDPQAMDFAVLGDDSQMRPQRRDPVTRRPEPPLPEKIPEAPPSHRELYRGPPRPEFRTYEHRPPDAWRGRNEPLDEPSATMGQLEANGNDVEFRCNVCRAAHTHPAHAMIALFGRDTVLRDLERGLTCLEARPGENPCGGAMWATVTLSTKGPHMPKYGSANGARSKSYYKVYGLQPPDNAPDP